jgi:hypothetical protein
MNIMSLLENQTFKKKISFVKTNDDNKTVTIVFSVQCNHDIDKNILKDIEESIGNLFLKDYEDIESAKEKNELEKVKAKNEMLTQKQIQKQQLQQEKQLQKQLLEQKKNFDKMYDMKKVKK